MSPNICVYACKDNLLKTLLTLKLRHAMVRTMTVAWLPRVRRRGYSDLVS